MNTTTSLRCQPLFARRPVSMDLKNIAITSPEESFDLDFDAQEHEVACRNVDDVLHEMKDHLTKEELLCVSLYKNSKRQRNHIYGVFLEKYFKKKLSSSAMTKRRHRMLHVLSHVGELLRFKRANGIDAKLREILTKKQYVVLNLYERRWLVKDIKKKLKLSDKTRKVHECYYRAIDRLEASDDPAIKRYITLLGNVLRFSRKYPTSKR